MFGGKTKQTGKRPGQNLQLGLFDVPTDFDPGVNIDDIGDDSDLEAELAALSGGGSAPSRPKRKNRNVMPQKNLNSNINDVLQDDSEDDDVSVDDNDPELLSELNDIVGEDEEETPSPTQDQTTPSPTTEASEDIHSLLQKRLEVYEEAEKHAKSIGETSRGRRYARAIKTLKDLIKQVQQGKQIDELAIPPEVSTTLKKHVDVDPASSNSSTPSRPAPLPPTEEAAPQSLSLPESPVDEPMSPSDSAPAEDGEKKSKLINMLNERKNQYKIAALTAKKSGDSQLALRYVKVAKQFEMVIEAVMNDQPVDLSKMPGPPGESASKPEIEQNKIQRSTPESPEPEDDNAPPEGLITASSVAEALEQRLDFFKKQEESAKEEGNASKARRYGRVVKQFEQAIKLNKAGKPISVDDLPVPPGFAPIPVSGGGASGTPKPAAVSPPPAKTSASSLPGPSSAPSTGKFVTTRADKQLALLLAKQKEFKLAALKAKQKGEINEAKEYLRQAKGFDKLVEAARGGLPVDLSSLPLSPSAKTHLDEDYDMVQAEGDEDNKGEKGIIVRLEAQLTKQLKMCLSTRDHNKAIGDVAGANRFERLALNVTKDLDVVRLAHKTPDSGIPKFHYENKEFAVVKSFTELNDNDLELTIFRGINYNCENPKDIDTYVKYEFPYPQDAHYTDKTAVVKNTNNPEYETTVIIPIQRTARTCQRVFKRHSLKLEVYAKGGFFTGLFKGDTVIGTANVKLTPLETQCEIHDSFDLMEGRKRTGGKIEVRLRVRQPIQTQEVEQIKEKWLVIDS